ncbi:MAG TPA: cytochrome c oxidase assembly protein [Jatrophihabitantaceae bacterium]|nr:cytochrome c oxidase assembly protein [Jatrophihabitantaceae bacterium]
MAALPSPELSGLVTEWRVQPVAIAGLAVLGFEYVRSLQRVRARGVRWPAHRSLVFAIGISLAVWASCGFFEAYGSSLYWSWTAQALLLLLVVPLVLLTGHPVELARLARGGPTVVDRALASRAGRFFGNPLVGPALVPLLSAVLFFGPLPRWAIDTPAIGWILDVLLVLVGALIVLPLVDLDARPSSLAVGLVLAIGSFELVLDAIPGIALRLRTSLATSWFDARDVHSWSIHPLRDQQIAGATLWVVAELIDLPFLLLVYRRWLRADARDAAEADAVLDAERAARAALRGGAEPDTDEPWWLTDPTMRDRMRRQG